MDQLIPSFVLLVAPFREVFARPETFATFQCLLTGWILAPGPRTISEVWQATGRAGKYHWDSAYSFFSDAKWEWDDIAKILILRIVASLIPNGHIFIIVDDTLCHKRGAKVAFGGFFLDAVTSTKKKKNFRFGVNWVVVGLSVRLPFDPIATSHCRSFGVCIARRGPRVIAREPNSRPRWLDSLRVGFPNENALFRR
ncbi:MAG: transposase [Nitrospira sp.]|nr:transposase [Nitrospira sp.]